MPPRNLGQAIFGPEASPLPFEARDDPGVAYAQPDQPYEEPGGGGQDYDSMVNTYLQNLLKPAQLPHPEPLGRGLAMALALGDRPDQIIPLLDRQYQSKLAESQLNMQRQGQAAQIAGGLAERKEARAERNYNRNWAHETAAANAGNINYPYSIKGLGEVARRQAMGQSALTGSRLRSNMGRGPRPKFATKSDHLAWLETNLRQRQSQLAQMYGAIGYLGEHEGSKAVREDAESDYGHLRTLREALGKMNEDQWKRFNDLTDEEQDAVLGSINQPAETPYDMNWGEPFQEPEQENEGPWAPGQ